jgi:hypothetical protein
MIAKATKRPRRGPDDLQCDLKAKKLSAPGYVPVKWNKNGSEAVYKPIEKATDDEINNWIGRLVAAGGQDAKVAELRAVPRSRDVSGMSTN